MDFPICVPRRRIAFIPPDGLAKPGAAHGNFLTYLGPQVERFMQVFGQFGAVKP